MMKYLALAAPALLFANPAAAVSVVDIMASGANSATVVTAESGQLSIDFAIWNTSTISVLLEGGDVVGFDSVADFFTGVSIGQNVRALNLSLGGAVFSTLGSVTPAFSEAGVMLNDGMNVLTIAFRPDGEGFGVILGNLDGNAGDFGITPLPNVGRYVLNVSAVVPEPATWGLMIAGFGLVGFAARRRERLARS